MPCSKPALALVVVLLAACDRQTPAAKAAQDARDVAWVEAAQQVRPPVQPLAPQPLSPAARRAHRLTGKGCDFRPGGGAPVMVAGRIKAMLRVHGEPMVLAADSGSAEVAAGLRRKYVGRTHWAELTVEPAALTIRDRYERIVYAAAGSFDCHG